MELLHVPATLHLGSLHGLEQALVLLVAFGPFVVLGLVVAVLRRRDVAAERASAPPVERPEGPAAAGGPGRGR